MSVKALMEYTRFSKYSRFIPELKRRETWEEQVDRVFNMHEKKYADKIESIREDFEFAKQMVKRKRVLGSQRALQFGGNPIIDKNAKLYNCTVSYVDRPRFFQECMYLLLCGCGTGFSVQTHHVAKLNDITTRTKDEKTFVVPDSIEGWADAIGVLVSSYFTGEVPFPEYQGHKIKFDFSKIRPAGTPLSWGGKAPGAKGLIQSIEKIEGVFDTNLTTGSKRLRPIDAYDIIMHASDAVLSGGIRRSATICIFSANDTEMANAKTGDWFIKNPQRGRSNNSALLIREKTSREDFEKLMKSVREFGEPGFIWSDDEEALYNPCFHPDTRIATADGLIKIKDLFESGGENKVIIDKRAGRGDYINKDWVGVEEVSASKVELTQKNANVFEVETEHGYSVKVTDNHEFPTNRGRLKVKDMIVGDEILIQSGQGEFGKFGSYEQGLILGLITGDGCICGEEAFIDIWEPDFESCDDIRKIVVDELKKVKSKNDQVYKDLDWQDQTSNVPKKRIGGGRLYRYLVEVLGVDPQLIKQRVEEVVYRGSKNFVSGYIDGIIFTDGSVQITGDAKKTTVSVRINQSNESLLKEIQHLLINMGIVSRIYSRRSDGYRSLPDGNGGVKDYYCKENFEIVINRPNSIILEESGLLFGRKKNLLKGILEVRGYDCNKPERFITKVKSIKFSTVSDVYCLYQDKTNTVISNGIVAGQCVEIGMRAYDDKGNSGWQFCNLCEINMKKCKTEEEFLNVCRAAAIIGTIQAGYDKFDYLGPVTESIVRREALLGCSMTGMMDSPEIAFNPEIQKKGAKLILKVNEEISAKIGINKCARSTCVKPAGSTSCLLGSASGIHPHHAKRYFRRVQANVNETPFKYFQVHNPRAVEKSVWSATGTDQVITFLCEVPEGAKLKNQLSAVNLLEHVRLTQQNWVEFGTREDVGVAKWLRHNVSNTITVRDDEWEGVADFIYNNRKWFAGISLLPMSGDLDYAQAPFCSVLDSREIISEYGEGALFASGLIVDGLHAFDNNLWAACDTALGYGEKLELTPEQAKLTNGKLKAVVDKLALKEDWVRRFKQFAERYCDGNFRRCTHLLKHVSNYKLWQDLKREYQEVDWSLCMEDDFKIDVTTIAGAACSGPGGCEMK